ncbi:MAG: 50S ribosomal protein L10 [Planctomycetota bacterium]
MARRVKELIQHDLTRRFSQVAEAVIIDFGGLSAEDAGEFRNHMRASGASVNVVKNTLFSRVLTERGLELPLKTLQGPTAIVHGADDAISASKLVADWRKKNRKKLPLKGGILGGRPLGPSEAERLTKMPSGLEVRQMVVSAVAGPLSALVGITRNLLGDLPAVVQAIADKKEKEGEAHDV